MPVYEYQCNDCGYRFEQRQNMTDAPLKECPTCKGNLKRLISGGSGFLLKGGGMHHSDGHGERENSSCSLEQTGRTCCGRTARCDSPGCGE